MPRRKEPTTDLGKLIRRLRAERQWTQEDLFRASGIPRTTLMGMEVGDPSRRVSVERLGQLAEALETPISVFLKAVDPERLDMYGVALADLQPHERSLFIRLREMGAEPADYVSLAEVAEVLKKRRESGEPPRGHAEGG